MIEKVKFRVGRYRIPVTLIYKNDRIFVKFPFNRKLIAEVKAMQGARWHGFDEPNPRKIWSISDSPRNQFQMAYLREENPYAAYESPLIPASPLRDVYDHQTAMIQHGLSRHYCIFACEMGTGKTLAAIEIMEAVGVKSDKDVWYVGPKSGVKAVGLELSKWESKAHPKMLTYMGLVKVMKNWQQGDAAPRVVIFDESSKLKTPTAQRSQAALHLADAVRTEHGNNGYVILMSGTPAPKTPADWWHQCEVACPGFLREGTQGKFKARLCLVEQRQSVSGGVYPHIITWLDDEKKCSKCGQLEDHKNHATTVEGTLNDNYHKWVPSRNEVEYLYKRMQGLVLVQFKKDCLDLPEKQYQIIHVKTRPDILRTAQLITKTSRRAIEALTLLRELSDGFQYIEEASGKKPCDYCHGLGKVTIPVPTDDVNTLKPQEVLESGFENREVTCDNCGGDGETRTYTRSTSEVGSPKDEAFIDLLDEHEDVGRFIVWGGFRGTIDRLIAMAHKYGWATLRVDGRGYCGEGAKGEKLDADELLVAMDFSHPKYRALLEKHPRLCFVGHPQAGGMALTLTASPTELFYSNCFNGEARMQAEDRFHRAGMDTNRAARIIDLIHLPSDKLVLDNLLKKKKLQSLSMGDLQDALERRI